MANAKTAATKKILVIVESPSKGKTISRYLGSRYKVMASVGHVRDLPKSRLAIDKEHDFEPEYINIRGKGDVIKELKKEAKKASKVLLATDPDREGEAISWHLAFLLGMDPEDKCRITFNEITKNAVKEAIKHPRSIDLDLVNAQQARRVLDRLVGYEISPLLWRKISRGLSAGRVQSAALKMICDRDREIEKFIPEEYWTITAKFKKNKTFSAKLATYRGKELTVKDEAQAKGIMADIDGKDFTVSNVKEQPVSRNPYPPYTTSTMQQDAANKLGFNTRKTMMIAQQLYEGINIKGHGSVGLISYIRTDSVRLSDEARQAAKEYITANYGADYWHNNTYSNRKKEIQDAHEAIRPAHMDISEDIIRKSLTADQFKLYDLIMRRFLASQMTASQAKRITAVIMNGDYGFKASGSVILFDGFRKVYSPARGDEDEKALPEMEAGEVLKPLSVLPEQNFTQPPHRYTEASLVKVLEEKNIGRPSTYAPIVATLAARKYISRKSRAISATELGFLVNGMMEEYFKEIVDAGFTADMEDKLDDIEVGRIEWHDVISEFYGPLEKEIEYADQKIEKVEIEDKPTGEICELCGRPMVIKKGRFGDFIACSGYPECKNTKRIEKSIGVKCPDCGKDILELRSRNGKIFYGCSGYPDCTNKYWDRPVDERCPKCGALMVMRRNSKKPVCSDPECRRT